MHGFGPAGWGNTNDPSVQAVMQLLAGNPQMYGAELQRQLAAGAGPYNIQAAQVSHPHGLAFTTAEPLDLITTTVVVC